MKKVLLTILSLVIMAGLVISIVMLFVKGSSSAPLQSNNAGSSSSSSKTNSNTSNTSTSSSSSSSTISLSDVEANDGLNSNPCWVVVEGSVYLVPEGTKDWSNGQHMKTNGQVRCGMDTGNIITSSPHGASVLRDLKKIGNLE